VKTYLLAFLLALLVVLSSVTMRRSVAGIGGTPAPMPPMSALGIGGTPAPMPPMSALGIGGTPAPMPPMK